jgi:hypothetical protein
VYQKKCDEDIMAIAHDDDLRLIEGVVCPLAAKMLAFVIEINE